MTAPTGVLLMAYGTPRGPDEVLEYYTDIRRGRPPSDAQLADLLRRYAEIGGVSPLAERTAEQVTAVAAALERDAPGSYVVRHGTKHARPRIEEAVGELASAGAVRLVGLVLAPHYSRLSVGEYVERARAAADALGLASTFVEHWHDDATLVDVLAERVLAARSGLGLPAKARVELVVTAHSLPERILAAGDPYAAQVAETAALVAARAGVPSYRTGWQSAGRTADRWLGPDILEELARLVDEGFDGVVVCPAGFTSDHLEVLYDLDVDARRVAGDLGLAFARTGSLNDEPRIAGALARRVARAAAGAWP